MKQTEEKNTERLLSLRRHLKERKPNFIRQDVVRKKTLKIKWRRPKGMHSKVRLHQRGNLKLVTKGYKSPQEVRGMLRTGLFPVLVHNVKELVEINTKTQSAVIGSTVGLKLKLEIVKKAIELKINLENVKHPSEFLKEKTDALKNKKLQKESKEKQQKEEEKKKESKKEKTIDTIAKEELSEEQKKEEEKKVKDKLLTSKGTGF